MSCGNQYMYTSLLLKVYLEGTLNSGRLASDLKFGHAQLGLWRLTNETSPNGGREDNSEGLHQLNANLLTAVSLQ